MSRPKRTAFEALGCTLKAALMQSLRSKGPKPQRPVKVRRKVSSPLDRAKAHEVVWNQVAPLFEKARGMTNPSFVYVVSEGADGPIKIGVAKDPIQRVRGMQTGNPRRLRVEHVLFGRTPLERLLHEMWEPHAIRADGKRHVPGQAPRTEWFNSETRELLHPIMVTAAAEQVAWATANVDLYDDDLERIVREAHGHHGFVPRQRHQTHLLAAGGTGYVVPRPSRL